MNTLKFEDLRNGYCSAVVVDDALFTDTLHVVAVNPDRDVVRNWYSGYSMIYERIGTTVEDSLTVEEGRANNYTAYIRHIDGTVDHRITVSNDALNTSVIYLAVSVDESTKSVVHVGFLSFTYNAATGLNEWWLTPAMDSAVTGIMNTHLFSNQFPDAVVLHNISSGDFVFTQIPEYEYSIEISGQTYTADYPTGGVPWPGYQQIHLATDTYATLCDENGVLIRGSTDIYPTIDDFINDFVSNKLTIIGTELIEYSRLLKDNYCSETPIDISFGNGYILDFDRYDEAQMHWTIKDPDGNNMIQQNIKGEATSNSWTNMFIAPWSAVPNQHHFEKIYAVKVPYTAAESYSSIFLIGIGEGDPNEADAGYWVLQRIGLPPNSTAGSGVGSTALNEDMLTDADIEETTDPREPEAGPEPTFPGEKDTSKAGGGEGDYEESMISDDIPNPTPDPKLDLTGSGENSFARIYCPTPGEMAQLANWMTDDNLITSLKKYFVNDPMDFIVSYHLVPGTIAHAAQGTPVGIGTYFSQNITMKKATETVHDINLGQINIDKTWGSCNDYAPHCNIQIYLPFIGFQTLDTNLVLPKQNETSTQLNLVYHINIVDGTITAVLSKTVDNNNRIIGEWGSEAIYKYPITAKNHDAAINAGMNLVTTAGMIASGGVTAPTVAALGLSGVGMMRGSFKPEVLHGGGIGGASGFMMGRRPYIIITRSHQALPVDYKNIYGFPAHKLSTVANATDNDGYMRFSEIHVNSVPCTEDEKNQIESLLLGGVYL